MNSDANTPQVQFLFMEARMGLKMLECMRLHVSFHNAERSLMHAERAYEVLRALRRATDVPPEEARRLDQLTQQLEQGLRAANSGLFDRVLGQKSQESRTDRVLRTSRERVQRTRATVDRARDATEAATPLFSNSVMGEAASQSSTAPSATPALAVPHVTAGQMEVVADQEIGGQDVTLDGKHFKNCLLKGCVVYYSGSPVVLETTRFEQCRFLLGGQAAATMNFLECLGLQPNDYKIDSGLTALERPN